MPSAAVGLMQTAEASGIEICFANPGTTEMPLVAALDEVVGIRAVLGLFEGFTGRRHLLGVPVQAGQDPSIASPCDGLDVSAVEYFEDGFIVDCRARAVQKLCLAVVARDQVV